MRATDYAAFSKAAYSEYLTKDLADRGAAIRKTLDEWGVDKDWHMVGNPLFSNSEFVTFINIKSSPHQAVISARGTDPTNVADLAADVDIAISKNITGALKKRVQKMVAIAQILTGEQQFTHPENGVVVGVPKDAFFKDDIVFTGHSLGGAVAAAAALQYDSKAVVYNMGSSPMQFLERRPKRNYDNVLHFTTNSVKDGVLDPVSVSQYVDRAGTGVHTVRYKMSQSKQNQSLMQNHSIDSFKRDPADHTVNGYDALYDEAIHALRQPYQTSKTGETNERKYITPDMAGAAERGRQVAAERARQEAEERARRQAAAAAAAARAQASHDWSQAHFWGSILGGLAMVVAAVATGGLSLGPTAALLATTTGIVGAATVVATTIGDDVVNYDKKTTTELILDGVGVGAVGLGAAAQGLAIGARLARGALAGYELVEGGVNAAEAGVNAAEAGVNAAEGIEAGVDAGVEMANLEGVGQEAADMEELWEARNNVAHGDEMEMEQFLNDEELEELLRKQNNAVPPDEAVQVNDDLFVDENDQLNRQQIFRDDEVMKAKIMQGHKLMAGGRAAIAASEVIGKVRKGEDTQDSQAESKRRRIGDLDPHNGSGSTPSQPPGSHMDKNERMQFVSDDVATERSLGYNNNTENVDNAPTRQLEVIHKSLMFGKGIDITTQIPLVTAAKGNYLRHLAQRSAMY